MGFVPLCINKEFLHVNTGGEGACAWDTIFEMIGGDEYYS